MTVFAKIFCYLTLFTLCFIANVWTMEGDIIFHGLPIIQINTENQAPIQDKVNYVPMQFILTDPNNPENNVSLIAEDFTDGGIRGRGNMTWTYAKKPYRIKFGKKTSLFGLEKAKSWILLAEYLDPTYLTTPTAFHLGDVFGMRFNHSYNHVELYLNEEYVGIYGLTEQSQVGKGRVDIDETEGWFVKMDSYYDEDPKFETINYKLPIMIKSPEIESVDISNPVFDFVQKDINELCDSMASPNFPENGYRNLIDMDNFIDYLIVNEIIMNHELAWPKSAYSYKDKNGKINMGPLWDFDWAYSGEGTHIFFQTHNFSFENGFTFFYRFFQDPIFLVKYKERWNEKYNEILDVLNFINELSEKIEISFAEDYERWKYYYGDIYPQNYIEEIKRMKKWYKKRVSILNTNLNEVEILPKNKTFTNQVYGYSEITPQTFTLVAYKNITELTATLKNGNFSGFEILRNLTKTKATDGGGYLATINVKPKNSLLIAATYTDTLILRGKNQEKDFVIKAPLVFVMDAPETTDPIIRLPQIAIKQPRIHAASNAIVLENMPKNAKVEAYNLQGKLIYSTNSQNSQILRIPIQTKGMYIVKVSNNILRIMVM